MAVESQIPVWVNGQKVQWLWPEQLQAGDILVIGSLRYVFRVTHSPLSNQTAAGGEATNGSQVAKGSGVGRGTTAHTATRPGLPRVNSANSVANIVDKDRDVHRLSGLREHSPLGGLGKYCDVARSVSYLSEHCLFKPYSVLIINRVCTSRRWWNSEGYQPSPCASSSQQTSPRYQRRYLHLRYQAQDKVLSQHRYRRETRHSMLT